MQLLNSPDRVIQISAKRQKTGGAAAWPVPTTDADADAHAASSAATSASALTSLAASVAPTGAPAPPALGRTASHLKRPAGLSLHDLQVPAQPSGVPPDAGDSLPPPGGELLDEIAPMADVASALSPLLATTFNVVPETMRSFLRLDDLTFDLLSPLGTGRPGEKKELEAFNPTE